MIHGLLPENRKHLKNVRKFLKQSNILMHTASIAAGLEALETLLVEKSVLKDGELMERMKSIMNEHYSKGEMIPPVED